MSLLIASKACSDIVLPVLFFTMKLAPEETPDCIMEAVLKPDVAGPTKAIGAMKQPDNITHSVVNNNNLFIIESPQLFNTVYIFL